MGSPAAVTAVTAEARPRASVVGLTFTNLVSTLEQSPARGDTAAIRSTTAEPAPVSERDEELTNGDRVEACVPNVVARRNKE